MNSKWFRYFFVVSVVVGAILVSFGFHQLETQHMELHALIVKNQHLVTQSAETAYQSAKTRIVTVTQRCELTRHIEQVLVKDDPRRALWFKESYHHCLKQLDEVKHIAMRAKVTANGEGL